VHRRRGLSPDQRDDDDIAVAVVVAVAVAVVVVWMEAADRSVTELQVDVVLGQPHGRAAEAVVDVARSTAVVLVCPELGPPEQEQEQEQLQLQLHQQVVE